MYKRQLQLSAHMLRPFQFQNYLPGPRYQVLAINPVCHDPHILVDFFLKSNLCRIYVMTFPHRVIRMCIFQHTSVSIKSKIFYLRQKKYQPKPNPLVNFFSRSNHVVSASGRLMPSHSDLTKSTTTSCNTSGGLVKIKLKLPHFHVSDTCRVSI